LGKENLMGFDALYAVADYIGVSATTASTVGETAVTAAEVGSAAATAAGAYTALSAGKRPVMPPSPLLPQSQQDLSVQDAEANAQRRQSIAGGINSTVGTQGGQGGAAMDQSNSGGKALLGM
jgi:hypothetical protein